MAGWFRGLRGLLRVAWLVAVCAFVLPAAASAQGNPNPGGGGNGGGHGGGPSQSPTGYDISYPQCGGAFPSNVLFGIVAVNDGIVYSPNPCLGTGDGASELAWAEQYDRTGAAVLYAATADPGPALSSHWPDGQTTPQACNATGNPGLDTTACSYDYGWNAAADSYQDAVNAYIELGALPAGSQTPARTSGGSTSRAATPGRPTRQTTSPT